MKNSIVLLAVAFLCLVAFPTTTVGKYWPNQGWPNPSEVSRNELMYLYTGNSFSYGDSKVWKCTYSNGSAPAISISPSTPFPSIPSTPSTPSKPSPSPPTHKTSPPPPTPSPPPPAPKTSPPSLPPPTPKKSPSPPPTPSLPPPTPKKSPSPPSTPSLPPPTPKKSPSPPPTPSLPPPTPKKSPSPPSTPSLPPPTPKKYPPPEHHHHHHQNPWEHIESCMRNMGPVGMCRMQMEVSYFTRLFRVSNYCCNLVVNMKNECDDVVWGFFNDPFFVPLVRYTCHVTC